MDEEHVGAGRAMMETNALEMLARMAEMMTTQQLEMHQLLQHQRRVLETMTVSTNKEKRVEGISMPVYFGKMGESLQVFLHQAQLYFCAKNIDVAAADNQGRLIAMVASNSKGQAAAWYTFHQGDFTTLNDLAEALQKEFVPPDLQERLRAELMRLRQVQCDNLEDYVSKFRQVISQVRDMSMTDQITWFVHGLVQRTREEVAYRRCSTQSTAISVALEFERSHSNRAGDSRPRRDDRQPDVTEPMEIDNVNVRTPSRSPRVLSRDECRRKNLCFRCKRPGHRMNECRVRVPP